MNYWIYDHTSCKVLATFEHHKDALDCYTKHSDLKLTLLVLAYVDERDIINTGAAS